uniref:ARAD1D17886p n=1 Tax=Blastobotrys adeninivorans TaxID=409370 RepID=A0A060TAD2_BLAAD
MLSRVSRTAVRSVRFARVAAPMAPRVAIPAFRSFSAAPIALEKKSSLTAADADLAALLKNEIKIEKEIETPESPVVAKFLNDSGFEVKVSEGSDLVELVRKDGSEITHVYFSLFDVTNAESFMNEEEDQFDEERNAGEEEEGFDSVEEDEFESPIRVKVVIEKPTGALSVEATVHDDLFLIQYVVPMADASMAIQNTAQGEHDRRQLYQGPLFSTLDPSVQSGIERYLEARNINSELASFIVEYATARENDEYIRWLGQLQNVVESE